MILVACYDHLREEKSCPRGNMLDDFIHHRPHPFKINDTLVVKYRQRDGALSSLKPSAIHLAAYTTAYARLRLYRLMELIGPKNICYSEKGLYLGQLTNELSGDMTEFVSLGPKTYFYKEVLSNGDEHVVVKTKGITTNFEVEKKLTFERMRTMVDEVIEHVAPRTALLLPQMVIARDKDHNDYCRNIGDFNGEKSVPNVKTVRNIHHQDEACMAKYYANCWPQWTKKKYSGSSDCGEEKLMWIVKSAFGTMIRSKVCQTL
ncbi:hypothetical protein B9Z55_023551 [Caenorhabditis nigoni]|uniref:Uncharacterized protein n=1 Tax=Caenorhabditis nigoni TaxID=1611254 RepID=A0A2G5SQK0_9PELO|nr:hypothetical protein B9Z55_023551 [Caenorhabditis nigoni]